MLFLLTILTQYLSLPCYGLSRPIKRWWDRGGEWSGTFVYLSERSSGITLLLHVRTEEPVSYLRVNCSDPILHSCTPIGPHIPVIMGPIKEFIGYFILDTTK